MDIWSSLSGSMEVELTSADPAAALLAIQKQGIPVQKVEKADAFTLTFQIRRRDYARLSRLTQKRSESFKVNRKNGLYWAAMGLKKRPILVFGLLLMLLFSLWVPRHIFFVQIEGNRTIPARMIAEKAAECGISFGANRRQVRSERMKNALMEAIPQLSWAGINTSGCTAVITVRERDVSVNEEESSGISSIIAARDGVIREMTVLKGNPLCVTGQAVKQGQVLISGYTDCGICIRATAAAGEIFAETKRTQRAVMPSIYQYRRVKTWEKKKYSLIIGKKQTFFANSSGISDSSCAKIYEEKYMTLPGGFVLPLAVAVETWICYETEEAIHPQADEILLAGSRNYLLQQMRAGSILASAEQMETNEDIVSLYAGYSCYEMIGITRMEENGLDYGKND